MQIYYCYMYVEPTTAAARSKTWVCGRPLAEIAGSNPAGDTDVFLLRMLFVVWRRCLRRADHTYRGVLLSVVCLSVIVKLR